MLISSPTKLFAGWVSFLNSTEVHSVVIDHDFVISSDIDGQITHYKHPLSKFADT